MLTPELRRRRLLTYSGWAVLFIAIAVLQLTAAPDLLESDSPAYIEKAYGLLHHIPLPDEIRTLRTGLTFPLAVTMAAFGFSTVGRRLFFVLTSLGTLLLTYLLAKEWFGKRVGIWAVTVLLAIPQFFWWGVQVLPDGPVAFYGVLAAYGFTKALVSSRSERRWLWAALAGASIGLAYLTKETGAYLLVIPAVLAILSVKGSATKPWRIFFVTLSAMAAVVVAESAGYWFATGDPLYRIHVVQRVQGAWMAAHTAPMAAAGAGVYLWGLQKFFAGHFFPLGAYAVVQWNRYQIPLGYFSLLFWIVGIAATYFAATGTWRRIVRPGAWGIILFGLVLAENLAYLDFYPRRFSVYVVPAVLVVAVFLEEIFRQVTMRWVAAVLLVPLYAVSLSMIALLSFLPANRYAVTHRLWDMVPAAQLDLPPRIYADCNLVQFMRYYDRYQHPRQVIDFTQVHAADIQPASYVMLGPENSIGCHIGPTYDASLLRQASQSWQVIGRLGSGHVVYFVP